jgi:hypothetical protein
MFGINGNWCSATYNNLWDAPNATTGTATMTDTEIVKTVYDPNPVGFKMPPSNAWTGFTLTGGTSTGANINASNVGTYIAEGGYRFYTQADKSGPTAFYPFSGYLTYRMTITEITTAVVCYSAMPYNDNNGMDAYHNSTVRPTEYSPKALAFFTRPITD